MRVLRSVLLVISVLFFVAGHSFAEEENDLVVPDTLRSVASADDDVEYDPFYTKGVSLQAAPPIQGILEAVDPFSGNLKIVQTDLELPQNGGLELKIMRFYDSAIWSRWDTGFPGIVALNRKSPLGLGWYMHMGIMRTPLGNTPVFEAPDGSRRTFYSDKNDLDRKISTDMWVCKMVSTSGMAPFFWEVTSPDGTIYTLESGGVNAGYSEFGGVDVAQVVKIQNPGRTSSIDIKYKVEKNPKRTPYSYLDTITDSTGRKISFKYNKKLHQLERVSTDSRKINYTYNTQVDAAGWRYNTLTKVFPPDGEPWKYLYENYTFGLKEITYPTGGKISYKYEAVDFPTGIVDVGFRVVTERRISGRDIPEGTWTYNYEPGGNAPMGDGAVTTVLGPDNVKEVYTYYSWNNCPNGYVWRVGRPMSKVLFKNGQLIQSESYTWDMGPRLSYSYLESASWYPAGGQKKVDAGIYLPLMGAKEILRDGGIYTTTYSDYDRYGNPETIEEFGEQIRTTRITYWTNPSANIVQGKPLTETVSGSFADSFTTRYDYYDDGKLKKLDQSGVITKYFYTKEGNLLRIVDANNNSWRYEWKRGRISKITNPLYSISRKINADGTIDQETDGRKNTTKYDYDKNLRLTKVTPEIGHPIFYTYPFDSSYRREQRGEFYIETYFDGFGRQTGTLNKKGEQTGINYHAYGFKNFTYSNVGDKTFYDVLDRPIQSLHRDNTSIRYVYDDNTVYVMDEEDYETVQYYASFGDPDEKLLVALRDTAGTVAIYGYNILGSLISSSYCGISRNYSYNDKNFLEYESHPETGEIRYGRDNVGNMTSKIDGTGIAYYDYDAINRLRGIRKGTESITFGYDDADNRTSVTSPDASYVLTFDDVNRLTGKTETILGVSYSSRYDYDDNDNLKQITYPGGCAVTYSYDSNNEVKDIPGFISSASYNLAGQPLSYGLGNGVNSLFAYNERYLPTVIGAVPIMDYSYGYDGDLRGNLTAINNNLDAGKNQTFTYDVLNRLSRFNGSWGSGHFSYDVCGNRRAKYINGVETLYYYSSNTNRLRSTSSYMPTLLSLSTDSSALTCYYNSVGCLQSGTSGNISYELTYDGFNQVKSILFDSGPVLEAGYDGDGLRVIKTTSAGTTVYHYDPAGNVLSESDAAGQNIADYVYLNGKLVGKVAVNSELGEEVSYYHTDPTGTVLAISDALGQKVWEADYKPFGEEYIISANEENTKRFVGKEKDIETGLNYFGARYLFSGIGRFLAPDAVRAVDAQSGQINAALLANPQRHNVYAYSLNNPYRYVDPDGRSPKDRSLFSGVGMGGSQGLPSYAGMDRAGNLRPIAKSSRLLSAPPSGSKGNVSTLVETTPGGRILTEHAIKRMTNPPKGRAPMTVAEVDKVLDTANKVKKMNFHPEGDTITVQNTNLSGKPQVVVDSETGKRVITVIKNVQK
nr:RHS repeat-associated core domain-containing protein [uncultured Desulfuromonas sp.]